MRMKLSSWFWKFGHLAFEQFWKSSGNNSKGVCMNPDDPFSLSLLKSQIHSLKDKQMASMPIQIHIYTFPP